MLIVISPAKTLDFEAEPTSALATQPMFEEEPLKLVKKLQTFSKKKLMSLMDISADLAGLNVERFAKFGTMGEAQQLKQAILAFKGDVYLGLEVERFSEEDLNYAQDHLRILSGLYGLLRPMDLIQPYRLEMGTSLKVGRKKNLYEFWDKKIAEALNAAIDASGSPYLINLASQEYFQSVKRDKLKFEVFTPQFLDKKADGYKVVSFWAKKARGIMTAWIIANRIENPESIKEFNLAGYVFNPGLSEGNNWAFTREEPEK